MRHVLRPAMNIDRPPRIREPMKISARFSFAGHAGSMLGLSSERLCSNSSGDTPRPFRARISVMISNPGRRCAGPGLLSRRPCGAHAFRIAPGSRDAQHSATGPRVGVKMATSVGRTAGACCIQSQHFRRQLYAMPALQVPGIRNAPRRRGPECDPATCNACTASARCPEGAMCE